ncbi:MAG: glycosyltransferase [Planctomycetota bacterium]
MNILHVMAELVLEHGGVVRAVIDLADQSARAGHAVTVVSWNAPDAPDAWRETEDTGSPTLIETAPPGSLGKLAPDARAALRTAIDRADVVHLHTPWLPANKPTAALCNELATPYVITLHGMLDDWCMTQKALKKKVYLALGGRKLLEGAAAVHCTAQAELDQSQRWYPRGTGVVAPLVFDVEPYADPPGPELARDAFGIDPDRPVVLFLSRLHVKKGVHVLVKAAQLLADRGIHAQTLIAGTGDEAYTRGIESQIAALGLTDSVRLLGMVSGETKVSLYQAADVFALPTSQENFGFVLPEALATGTPAITTKGVDIWPELEASGSTVIAEQTPEAFADAIADLLGDDQRRAAMGAAGRDWVLTELNADAIAKRYDELYRVAQLSEL